MKIFISGPMTGIEDYNFPAFNKTEDALSSLGHDVVNPVKICMKYEKERVLADRAIFDRMVQEELDELETCDAIYMLPGWESSKGALKEHDSALAHGIEVLYAKT